MFNRSQAIKWIAYTSSKNSPQKFLLPLHSQVSWKYPEFSWFFGLDTKEQNKPHVFHGTNFQAPNYGQKRTVLTIHDLWLARFPQYSKKLFGQTLSSWKLGRRANRVSRVIAVSQFSAREIQDMFHLPAEHIAVIPHGCSPDMFPVREERKFQEVRARLQLPARPFILFVGGAEPRKNHTVLFSAFSRSARLVESFSLVAVGEVESRGASLVGTARELGISDSVCCPGYVSVEDLRMLYSHAVGFVFPSLYEGFGMPLLEAMACGAPTIIATGSALSEVGGDAVLYVNPQDPEQLGVELERLVSDQGLQEQLRTKGFERVKQFTWDRAAQQTLDLYWEVLGS